MKHRIFPRIFLVFLTLIIILSIAVYFFSEPILLSIANKQLQRVFKRGHITAIEITGNFIEFQGIEIAPYDLKIERVRINYNLRSLFNRQADFYIEAIDYNKLKIGNAAGRMELKGDILYINPVSLNFLGGNVKGEFTLSLNKNMDYTLILDSYGLEVKKLVNDMELNERFDMTGRMDGEFTLSGNATGIKDIKGGFRADKNGGTLIIKDKTLLENVARQSNQPLDILVESFRNYNYNNGILDLYIDKGSLTLDLKLDGYAGKRSLTIVLHEFTNNLTN